MVNPRRRKRSFELLINILRESIFIQQEQADQSEDDQQFLEVKNNETKANNTISKQESLWKTWVVTWMFLRNKSKH